MIRRLLAFLVGDMLSAEDLSNYPAYSTPPLVKRAQANEALAEYVASIGSKARDRTDAVLTGIQTKASSFLTLVVGLLPLALAAVALGVPPDGASPLRWSGFLLLLGATVALLAAASASVLACGMGLTASLNLEYMEKEEEAPKTMAELLADEADTWHYAAVLNMETGRRRAADLFRARQLAVLALFLTLIGLTALLGSVGGNPAALLGHAEPSRPPASPGIQSPSPS